MGLFNKICSVCGKETGMFYHPFKGGNICHSCYKYAGYNAWTMMATKTYEEVRADVEASWVRAKVKPWEVLANAKVEQKDAAQLEANWLKEQEKLKAFQRTRSFAGGLLELDEINSKIKIMAVDQWGQSKPKVHDFSEILNYEMLESSMSVSSGGKADEIFVAGFLFGSSTAKAVSKKRDCQTTSLQVKITLNDLQCPQEFIQLTDGNVPKGGLTYQQAFQKGQEILSILDVICQQQKAALATQISPQRRPQSSQVNSSTVAQLKEYKELLDIGIISEEEFLAKKKELLNL